MSNNQSTIKTSGLKPEGILQPLCQIATPLGMLGYGFDEGDLFTSLEELASAFPSTPTAIIIDSGSTDSGPSKLALGTMTCPRSSYKRDLTKLIKAVLTFRIPMIVSSAGGDGSNKHVDEFLAIIREIMASLKCSRELNVLSVYAEISKEVILERLQAGKISGCGDEVPGLTAKSVNDTPRILAQMGPEPILETMIAHPSFDILLAGRAYDPAPFVAFCAFHSLQVSFESFNAIEKGILGGFSHMGKIMECGGLCATPKSSGATAVVYVDGTFDIAPMQPGARCVPLTVAAHTLYEKSRPDLLPGPGGHLDLRKTTYEQLENDTSVRAKGAIFEFSVSSGACYTVKLEGAKVVGFRTLFMGSFRDPILIGQIHTFLATGKSHVAKQHLDVEESWNLDFHLYGLPLGSSAKILDKTSTEPDSVTDEIFVIGEVLADSQDLATSIASAARVYCTHAPYEGQKATSGNFAMGIGGMLELVMGPCSEFSVYHLMNLIPGEEGTQMIGESGEKVITKDRTVGGLFPWQNTIIEPSTEGDTDSFDYKKTVLKLPRKNAAPNNSKLLSSPLATARTLRDIAKVIRSKNSGPFQITFDVIFDDPATYDAVKSSGLLHREVVADLFGRSMDDIIWCGFFDQALAFKVTFPRRRGGQLTGSGGYLENDVHASQQYMPLMNLELGDNLVRAISRLQSERKRL